MHRLSVVPFACAWIGDSGQLGESTWGVLVAVDGKVVELKESAVGEPKGETKDRAEPIARDVAAAREGAELRVVPELLPVVEVLSLWSHLSISLVHYFEI